MCIWRNILCPVELLYIYIYIYMYVGNRMSMPSVLWIWTLPFCNYGETVRGHLDIKEIMSYTSGVSSSRTPRQTPHFDTRSEINPSRTLVKNEIMKTFKSALVKHRKSHSSPIFHSPKGSWKISETCAEINPSCTRSNAICISSRVV